MYFVQHRKYNESAFYRPQRSWAKVMFLQASVILSTGGGLPHCMLGYHHHPLQSRPPWNQTPPPGSRPSGADTPLGVETPPGADTPQEQTHPPPPTREADSGIRSTNCRYASYWNAFLFVVFFFTCLFFQDVLFWQNLFLFKF